MSVGELLASGHEAWRAADFARALSVAEEARVSLVRAEVAADDELWGHCDTLRALALRDLGRLEDARAAGERAVNAARERGWLHVLPLAMLALGRVHVGRGDTAAARPLLAGARAVFEARGASERVADCAVEDAVLAMREGRVEDCEAHIAEAVRRYDEGGDTRSAGLALLVAVDARRSVGDLQGAAEVLRACESRLQGSEGVGPLLVLRASQATQMLHEGQPGAAIRLAQDALKWVIGDDSLSLRARLWNLVGEAHHEERDHDVALLAWARSAELYDMAGDQDGVEPRANEAMGLIDQGRYEEARPRIASLLQRLDGHRRVNLQAVLHALMLPCVVDARDWGAWAYHYRRASVLTAETRLAERGAADAARRAGELCARAAWSGRDSELLGAAVRANALALELYRRLGRENDAVATARALNDLGRRGGPVPAGPFDLHVALGRGAMGEVWRARHHARREPVAVKVVGRKSVSDPRFQALIESEIRAMATLDHPNIVRVIDHGVLGPEAEAVGHGVLRRDSPWFAMELATGGSLEPLCGELAWPGCRQILLVLLDALAHAHARGVFHLDLKPANVLLRESGAGALTVLLTDFGLAHIVARASGGLGVAGTPAFMAPEQFEANHRDYGPWTDLYGLGCLATHLVSAAPPFEGEGLEVQRQAHLEQAVPPLQPKIGVPDGLEAWIADLLAKAPRDRFQQAADAAWALRCLEGNTKPPTMPFSEGWEVHRPTDGHRSAEAAPQLFRLRRPALVGRHTERDALWASLRRVSGGRPGLVVLSGSQGVGKTALARWLCERAQETGAATTLDGGASTDGATGLRALVVRRLRLDGLDRGPAEVRIRARLPALSRTAAAGIAVIAAEHGIALGAEERVSAVAELARVLSAERALVVRLELGNPVDLDVAALAETLLEGGAPILMVLEATELAGLEPLLDRPGVEVVPVPPMRQDALLELVSALVPFEPQLEGRIVEQAAGNPDHAVQVIADLVERDSLTETPAGWTLRSGGRIRLPARLRERYGRRVELVRRALARPAREAVAAAALLGIDVGEERWSAICAEVELNDPEPVFRRMRTAALAVRHAEKGWRFSHPAARELVRSSWASREAYVVAARVLDGQGGDPGLVGWLWAEAEELSEAVALLLKGASAALARGDGDRALELIDRRAEALRTLGVGEDAAAWAGDAVLRAELTTRGAGRRRGLELAERAVELSITHGLDRTLGQALTARGSALIAAGQRNAAREGFEQALVTFDALNDAKGVGRCLRRLGDLARAEGDLDEAERLYERALGRLRHVPPSPAHLRVRAAMAMVRVAADELAPAEEALLEVLQDAEDLHDRDTAVECLNALGNVARYRGELKVAHARYKAALGRTPGWRARRADLVRLNQAMVMLAERRSQDAGAIVDAVLAGAEDEDRGPAVTWCRLAQLPVLAKSADDGRWERHIGLVERIVAEARLWERDAAWLLELAGHRACEAELPQRADRPWRLAEQVYRAAGQPMAAEAVARALETLTRTR